MAVPHRAALIAFAAAAIALWLWRRDREPATPAPVATVTAPAPVRATPPASRRAVAPAEAPEPESGEPPVFVVDAVHTGVQAIGKACWKARTPREVPRGQPDDSVGRLELRLEIAIAGGDARVTDVEVVLERRLREDLRDCILEDVAAATWRTDAPDGGITLTELFRMGDYTVPEPGGPPPTPPPPPG